MTRGRPWVRLKLAASLDGRTALADGESHWITGEAARADVQRLRARSAVLTGIGTVLADDPRLDVRHCRARVASRCAWCSIPGCALPPGARVLAPPGEALILCTRRTPQRAAALAARPARSSERVAARAGPASTSRPCSRCSRRRGSQRAAGRGGARARRRAARRRPRRRACCSTSRRRSSAAARGRSRDLEAPASMARPARVLASSGARTSATTCCCGCAPGGGGLMFTGIVKAIGRVRRDRARGGGARRASRSTRGGLATAGWQRRRQHRRERRVPDGRGARRPALRGGRCRGETLARTTLGGLARRRRGQPRAGAARRATRSAGTSSPATSTASARVRDVRARRAARCRDDRGAGGARALRRAQGLDRGRRRQPHRRARRRARASRSNLIPHTRAVTTLGALAPGARVNLEVDLVARYLERLLATPGDAAMNDASRSCSPSCAAGRMVILVDDEDRENEGDLVMAADPRAARGHQLHGAPRARPDLPHAHARALRALRLPPMVRDNGDQPRHRLHGVDRGRRGRDHRHLGADRARTVQAAVAPDARPEDLRQPGHIFPLQARPGGVLMRAGHTEAGCDLARLAGLRAGRGDLRDHERRRHDGAPARPRALRARARPQDRHDRRPDRLPARATRR